MRTGGTIFPASAIRYAWRGEQPSRSATARTSSSFAAIASVCGEATLSTGEMAGTAGLMANAADWSKGRETSTYGFAAEP